MRGIHTHIEDALIHVGQQISLYDQLQCPILAYTGPIYYPMLDQFVMRIEEIAARRDDGDSPWTNPRRLAIILTTSGGVVEVVEKMVDITRHFFDEVYFFVPVEAMSAGTIWCMSGDKIFMDYISSLGPIDPQVPNPDGQFVPALGYIDKVNEIIAKPPGTMSDAEALMISKLDVATLRRYEQARDLSITLLKEWLVKFKFKDWTHHRTTSPGSPVTGEQKDRRAEEIARDLSDNNLWHSHGRLISIDTLRNRLHLEIEDYSRDSALRENLRTYAGLISEYLSIKQQPFMFHTPPPQGR